MKKGLCILLVFAAIFAFAACNKENKGEIYVAPHTEIITFENGKTAIYEVMTDDHGKPVTDEEGITELIPYDPPVTEKGGYIVTTPEGETIKQSQTTVAPSVEVDHELIDFDKTTAPKNEDATTKKGETTATKPTETTLPSNGGSLVSPGKDETTTLKEIPEGVTHALNGELSKADAQKLVSILSIDNSFDSALADGDYYKAEEQLPIYMDDIEEAISKIKADKKLYKYVGDENLQLWHDYIVEAQDRYAIFMGVAKGVEGEATKPKAFFSTYEDFQNYYRFSLQVFYHMKLGAEMIMYS